MRLLALFFAIQVATAFQPFGLALLSIALVGGWYLWPALKSSMWTDKLPPPERDSRL